VDEAVKITPQPYDLMTFTNLFMFTFAAIISSILAEFTSGIAHCAHNPQVFSLIWKFSMRSAIGQSFIFYTVHDVIPWFAVQSLLPERYSLC
jgi:UDP-galactose transporter B1